MKAIVREAYGTPDVLRLEEVPEPVLGEGDVLVRVRAAGVNPGDVHLLTGKPYLMRLMGFGLLRPKQRVLGFDLAGTVEAVGKDVTSPRPGDDVLGWAEGTFAERVRAPADHFVRKPERLSFEQAGALVASGATALSALQGRGEVEADQHVLIAGASGGVGTHAVQIAKALGAEVTGVTSAGNVELVRALGADHVIDYTHEDFTRGERRYDVIVFLAGRPSLRGLRRALTPRGTLVLVGGSGGRWLGGMALWLRALLLSPFVRQRLRPVVSVPDPKTLETLAALVSAERLTPVIDRTFPLAEAAEALRYVGQGHARGKVVLRP